MATNEKTGDGILPAPSRNSSSSNDPVKIEENEDAFEVFKRGEGNVDFRTVPWWQASMIFLKRKSEPPVTLMVPF